jgi:serine/threonine protein kinase
MGTVYLATDNELGREVAIKVSSALTAPFDLETRMRTEAHILARLEHPGIVPIHDVGTLPDGRAYYVMKRVRGKTLDQHIDALRDLNELLRIFERICETVAFAHAAGYVHRDLKPENIMVGSFGEVLVMDWGVAKVLGLTDVSCATGSEPATAEQPMVHTDPGTVMGTPGFMPPEQALGLVEAIDQRSDVYALGAILSEMLRRVAAAGPGADLRIPGTSGAKTPKRLGAICTMAMAVDAADRYASVDLLGDDVARYRAGRPLRAYRETLLDRAGRLFKTYRVAILLVIAYLIMRVIVAIWFG